MGNLVTTYGDHIEDPDGHLIPGPLAYHPALEEVRDILVRKSGLDDTWHELTLFVGNAPIRFRRGLIAASDASGRQWIWVVWVDEFGRGVAGKALQVTL